MFFKFYSLIFKENFWKSLKYFLEIFIHLKYEKLLKIWDMGIFFIRNKLYIYLNACVILISFLNNRTISIVLISSHTQDNSNILLKIFNEISKNCFLHYEYTSWRWKLRILFSRIQNSTKRNFCIIRSWET